MPSVTRLYIKSSLLYLIFALATGAWLYIGRIAQFNVAALRPVYFHLFMVGWITQIIFGVAFWFLPKFSRENPHRSDRLAYLVFVLLNAGLLLRVVSEPLYTAGQGNIWSYALVLSAILQWVAGIGFVVNTWGRVKER